MFTFQADEDFEPSANTKRWWLYTHKTRHTIANVELPGLFQTTHHEWQVLGVLAIVLLEGLATWQAWDTGVVITAILFSILLDFVLAVFAHRLQADICLFSNHRVVADDNEQGKFERQLGKARFKQRVFYVAIMLSAVFKFLWFYNVYPVIDPKAIFVLMCYTVGGILHISCTGYAVFTLIHEFKLRREHNRYVDSKRQNFKAKADFLERTIPLKCEPLNSRDAHVVLENDSANCYLRTKGVLMDTDLVYLTARQKTDEQKRQLAVSGLAHQLTIMMQDPTTGAKES